jgi:tRNA-modifying protein YgfZ
MHHMPIIFLPQRALLQLSGEDVASFLNGLLTRSILNMAAGEARFAALLSPQGKIITDMFVILQQDSPSGVYWLDCPASTKQELMRKLTLYRLKAKVAIS